MSVINTFFTPPDAVKVKSGADKAVVGPILGFTHFLTGIFYKQKP